MNDVIVFLLKVIVVVIFGLSVFYFWKVKSSKSWENLIVNKQQTSGEVLLERTNYSFNYARVIVLVIALVFVFRSPLLIANVLNGNVVESVLNDYSYQAEADSVIDRIISDAGEVYITTIEDKIAEESYKVLDANSNSDLVDYYTYTVDVVEEYYANDVVMFSDLNSKVVLTKALSIEKQEDEFKLKSTIRGNDLTYNSVYLVLGNYIDHETGYDLEDERLHDENYILAYEVILLPGYDLSKSFRNQDEDIIELVEDYTKRLD